MSKLSLVIAKTYADMLSICRWKTVIRVYPQRDGTYAIWLIKE